MAKEELYHITSKLPYFTRAELSSLGVKEHSLSVLLSREVRAGRLLRLKRDRYVTKSYIDSLRASGDFSPYLEFLANVLVAPSYITAEYVLAEHELLTEAVTTITSFTASRPGIVSNSLYNFRYRRISKNYHGTFETIEKGAFTIKKATKVQALLDFLYMKKRDHKMETPNDLLSLRLNLHLLTETDLKSLHEQALRLSNPGLRTLTTMIGELNAA